MKLENYLYEANKYTYFTYLNGNDIKYKYSNFGEHLAFSNGATISTIEELKKELKVGKRFFGHLSYDLKNELHNMESNNLDSLNFPLVHFFEPEHYYNSLSEINILDDAGVSSSNRKSKIKIESRFSKKEYISIIEKLRNHIIEGDCYEINFCMEFYAENVNIDPIQLYKELNSTSPMPFSALHKVDDKYLICASPERFLKKKGDKLISQPIKGTISKGDTEEENERLKMKLFNDEKERAENLMIVDLVRNDLAKSSVSGSVKVEELFGIYGFSNVNQMISSVVSEKKNNISSLDSVLNAYPMGSMTGAPKIKVMNLIEQYERTKRGIYSGSVGYFDENGDYDFNVVIRSIAYNQTSKYLSFQVGGAITFDSIPEKEYEECLLKASAIIKVLSS